MSWAWARAGLVALASCLTMVHPAPAAPRIFLDTHLDTPVNLARPGWSIMARHSFAEDGSQVDYPRMVEGGLDGGFWAVFTRQGPLDRRGFARAHAFALGRLRIIRRMVAANPAHFALARRADDAARIVAAHKRVVFISMENSYPLGPDASELDRFYRLGVRMVGPVHEANNEFADSSTDPTGPRWGGLSPAGRALVARANRLGMLVDASHASDQAFDQMLAASRTPIILSHTSCRALLDHPRNIDDDRLRRLAGAGGVIQLNLVNEFLVPVPADPAREAALAALRTRYGPTETLTPVAAAALMAERRAIDLRYPVPQATFEDFIAQLQHAIAVAGVDHVGIGADWDGGTGVEGLRDASGLGRIETRLRQLGYGDEDIDKILGGNVLRVLRRAEAFAARQAAAHRCRSVTCADPPQR